jgi:hypothetical protein
VHEHRGYPDIHDGDRSMTVLRPQGCVVGRGDYRCLAVIARQARNPLLVPVDIFENTIPITVLYWNLDVTMGYLWVDSE